MPWGPCAIKFCWKEQNLCFSDLTQHLPKHILCLSGWQQQKPTIHQSSLSQHVTLQASITPMQWYHLHAKTFSSGLCLWTQKQHNKECLLACQALKHHYTCFCSPRQTEKTGRHTLLGDTRSHSAVSQEMYIHVMLTKTFLDAVNCALKRCMPSCSRACLYTCFFQVLCLSLTCTVPGIFSLHNFLPCLITVSLSKLRSHWPYYHLMLNWNFVVWLLQRGAELLKSLENCLYSSTSNTVLFFFSAFLL